MRKSLARDPTLQLIASLVRVNDLEDASLLLEVLYGHDSRQVDLSLCKDLLQALFALLIAAMGETERTVKFFW